MAAEEFDFIVDFCFRLKISFLTEKGQQTEKLMNSNMELRVDEQGEKIVVPMSSEF